MKMPVRIAKWIAIAAGSLLLLLAAGVFVLTSVIDPNRYRGPVERIVGDLTGRPLAIEGDLQITWYPWLGVRMGRARLDNRPGGSGPPLAEWESLAVAAKLLPLLEGQVVVDRIRLQSPHIRLFRDREGDFNWEGLGPRGAASAAAAGDSATNASPKGKGLRSPPRIAGLEIRDGVVDYSDEASGRRVSLSGLSLDMGEWRAGQPLPISTRFVAHTDSLPPKGLAIELEVPELNVSLDPLRVTTPKAKLRMADARVEGEFNFEQTSEATAATVGMTPRGPAVGMTRRSPTVGITARGAIDIHVPSVRKLAADLALNQTLPRDPTTLGPLELTTQWTYTDGALTARPVTVRLDDVNFNGWVERGAPPQSDWRFELHGDRIDLGRYVNVDTTSTKPFELPVDALRAFNANGSVTFEQAVLADARMSDVRLKFLTPESQQ